MFAGDDVPKRSTGSKPVRKGQIEQAGVPVRVEKIVANFVFAISFDGVFAPIGARAIQVRESVFTNQGPRAVNTAGFFFCLGIIGQGNDSAADIARRFGHHEIRGRVVLIVGVCIGIFSFSHGLPIGFGDSEMLKDRFRAQKTRSHGNGDNIAPAQFTAHGEGEPDHGSLDLVVKNIAAIVERVAVRDFEDDRALAAKHQWHGKVRRDDVGMESLLEHLQAFFEVHLPERLGKFREGIAAPDIVDENVQAFVALFDGSDKFFYLGRLGVIDAQGNAEATRGGDEFRGFLDGLWTAGSGAMAPGASSRTVDRGAGFTECDGDTATSAARGAGDNGDTLLEVGGPLGGMSSHGQTPTERDA